MCLPSVVLSWDNWVHEQGLSDVKQSRYIHTLCKETGCSVSLMEVPGRIWYVTSMVRVGQPTRRFRGASLWRFPSRPVYDGTLHENGVISNSVLMFKVASCGHGLL